MLPLVFSIWWDPSGLRKDSWTTPSISSDPSRPVRRATMWWRWPSSTRIVVVNFATPEPSSKLNSSRPSKTVTGGNETKSESDVLTRGKMDIRRQSAPITNRQVRRSPVLDRPYRSSVRARAGFRFHPRSRNPWWWSRCPLGTCVASGSCRPQRNRRLGSRLHRSNPLLRG